MKLYVSDLRPGDKYDALEFCERPTTYVSHDTLVAARKGPFTVERVEPRTFNPGHILLGSPYSFLMDEDEMVEVVELAEG